MSNNSLASIRAALLAHLGDVTQIQQLVLGRSGVADQGFPLGRVFLVASGSEKADNRPSNYRTYTFAIDLFQETSQKTKAAAEADLQDAIDAVLDKLEAKWRLPDGSNVPTVDDSVIRPGPIDESELPFGPSLRCTIILECRTLIES